MKYNATVTFEVFDFTAEDLEDANGKINHLIDLLANASEPWESLNWFSVQWKAEVK